MWDNNFTAMTKYPRMYNQYREAKGMGMRDGKSPVVCLVFWGPAGGGKSPAARLQATDYASKSGWRWWIRAGQENLWWSGYNGEEIVILDEFEPADVPINTLKLWLDPGPCQVAGKGQGYIQLSARLFIITCQHHPKDWYAAKESDQKALAKRITKIFFFPSKIGNQSLSDMWAQKDVKHQNSKP